MKTRARFLASALTAPFHGVASLRKNLTAAALGLLHRSRRFLFALCCLALPASVVAAPTRALLNLSARANAGGTGSAALASSFTIEGSASKTVLIRAVGPKLAAFSVSGFMPDPLLAVFDGFGLRVAENDNWGSAATSAALVSATSAVGALSFDDNSKDAALLLTLAPGTYTARVDGVSGSTGVAQLEVYDADTVSLTPRLAYLNLKAPVASGVPTIVGFVIAGGASQTVLIRGLGPALASAGLTGTLSNPSINVFNSSSVSVASNDNWGTAATSATVADAAVTAGLRPLADAGNDAALVTTLAPGAYTVQLTGVSSSAGNALVEVAVIDADRAATLAPALLGPVLPVAGAQTGGMTLSAHAIGRPAPTYQWKKNGSDLAGSTAPSLTLNNLAAADAANYSVTVSNTAGSVISLSSSATVWSPVTPTTANAAFYGVAYNGTNLYVAVGESGLISTSVDGLTWTRAIILNGVNSIFRSVAYGGGRFVAVGASGTIRVSTDGATWTTATSGTANQLNSVLYDGTRFVAVGASSTVVYSTDAAASTWAAGNLGTASKTLNAVAFKSAAPATYVAVTGDGSVYSTADATSATAWTAGTSSGTNSLNAVAYVNDRFVAVGNTGTIRSSTTGTGSWTTVTSPTTNTLNSVAHNAGLYVAVGGNTLVTSADATTWTTGTFLPVGSASANRLLFAGGQFVSVGFSGTVTTSPTGASNTWTLRTGASTVNFNDTTYGNGRYVAVGSQCGILTTLDGTTLTSLAPAIPALSSTTLRRVIYAVGVFVAVGDNGTVLSSPDGLVWSNRSLGTANYTALAHGTIGGVGKFVAAGAGGAFATSADGIAWTAGPGGIGGSGNVTGLAHSAASSVFVAVNSLGGIFTSTDAATWTAQTSNTSNALNNVRFAGGQFIALGAASTVLTSPNGTTWTHRALGATAVNLVDVAHGGGMNIAVHTTSSFQTTLFLSADGITWTPAGLSSNSGPPVLFSSSAGIAYGNGSFLIASNSGIVARTFPHTGLQRILTQPAASTTIAAGGSATLTVTTSAASGSVYQWFRGASGDTSAPIAGATAATYNATLSARYWVQVSGASSPPINSATAAVTGPAPTINAQPVAATFTVGQPGSLPLPGFTNNGGVQLLTYQWRKFGTPISGNTSATTATLNFPSPALTDAGYYDIVVSDGLSSVTSKAVRVDVVPATASYGTVYRPRASAPRIEVNSGNVTAIAVDPADSNKLYVAGEFTRIDSTVRLNVARFLANGDFDSTWAPVSIIGGGSIRALLVESDGLIIAGDFSSIGGTPRGRLAKLSKTDGSLLTAFASGTGASSTIYSLARQTMADASVRYLLGGSFSSYDGTTVNRLVRIDANGARDTAFVFSPTGTAGFNGDVRALLVDGTGTTATIYAGGTFTSHHGITTNRNRLVRLDSTGAYDTTFNVGTGFNNTVAALALSGTGATAKLYAGGAFTSVNDVTTNRNRLARLDATGAYETSFAVGSGFGGDVLALTLDSSGNVYVAGAFTSFSGTTSNRSRLIRLTSGGLYDTAFNNGLVGANSQVNTLLLLEDTVTPANSRLLFGGFFTTWNGTARDGFARVATDATAALDAAPAATFRRPGTVYAVEPAPNGKWYIGGTFNFIDDQVRNHFARLNSDGTLDPDFANPGTGFNSNVNALAVQGDGRIVAAGNFSSFAGTTRNDILRLLPDGTLDTSFHPGTGFNSNVNAVQLLPDGRIVAVGNFTTYGGTTRNRIARILSDGTLDATFDPVAGFTATFNAPAPLALQSDGKLVVGGIFTTYNSATANGLVRILDTGLIDTTYNTGGAGFASNVDARQLFTRLDDQLVASGAFTTYNGTARSRIARISSTGAIDTTFAPNTGANSTVTAFHLQPDDKIILAGFYTSVLGVTRNVFSRFTATGTLDSSFLVPTVVNPFSNLNVIRPDASGNLLVAATRLDFAEFLGRGSLVVLEPAPVPAITAQPVAQTGTTGGSATFSVTATGESLQFQWLKNGVPLATGGNVTGATTASLALSNLTLADVASYSVTVTNPYGTVTSAAVSLSGSAPLPTITAQPVAATGTVGGGTTLTVGATGAGTLAYQWRKFGVPLAGANTATLNLTNLGLDAAGYYDVVVSDGLSVRVSSGAQVSVAPTAIAGALRPRTAFEPRVELVGIVTKFAPLADGRFYATGSFTQLDGTVCQGIVRFLANGTRDPDWNPPLITGSVNQIAVQSNDQVLIGGNFGYVGGVNQFRLARLNPDGTLDTVFAAKIGSGLSGGVANAIAIQPADQKILLAGQFTGINGHAANRIVRLLPDGSPDSSFAIGSGFDNTVNAFALQSDTKIVAVGNFTSFNGTAAPRIVRLTSLGAVDSTFVTGTGFEFAPAALAIQPADQKIVVVGSFVTYNNATSNGLVRLDSLGARETGFPAGVGFGGLSSTVGPLNLALQTVASANYLVIGGNFTSYNGSTINRLVRIAATDGTVDSALNTTLGTAGLSATARHVAIQGSTNHILVGGPITLVNATARSGLVRFNADGTLDSLHRQFLEPGQVFAIRPVANGKFIVGGIFSHVGGTPVANLARLDATGALDSSFTPGTGPNGTVRAIVLQGDGRLVIGGAFTGYNGVTAGVNRLARLSADGLLDNAFATAFGSGLNGQVNALALLPDGRIAAGGAFTTLNGATANRLARLHPSGAPDTAFTTATGTGLNGTVSALVAHADGRLTAGGSFTTLNAAASSGLARVLSTGAPDTTFLVGTGISLASSQSGSFAVTSLALQPDDRLVAGGFFGVYNNSLAPGLLRLTATGGHDHSFAVGTGTASTVQALSLQSDGRVVVAGNFTSFNGLRRGGLARLSSTGSLDLSFGAPFAAGAPSSAINVLAPLADGSFLVGSTTRQDFIDRIASGLLLLENAPSPTLLTVPFGGAVVAGNSTTVLSVSAAGTQPLTYQWKHNNVAVPENTLDRLGATTNTLSFLNFQAADAGTYTVTVTDSLGTSVTTPPVVFSVIESAPVLGNISSTFGPTIQADTAGYLSVPYTGSPPTSVAWTKNGASIAGGFYASGLLHLPLSPARLSDAGVYQVTATNALGTSASAPIRIWVSEEAGWTPHNPLPSPQGLLTLSVDNGQFLAGGLRGARLASTDGIAWTQLPALSQNNVFNFLQGNGRRLLVGSLGFVAISTDGVTWRKSALPTFAPVQGSAFGAGLFVVSTTYSNAPGGLAKIYTSPDGEVWTERYSTSTTALNSLTFGNGAFALFTGDRILRSTNGTDWTSHAAPATGSFIRFANGQFFLPSQSYGDLHVSTDALAWTTRSYGSTGARDITYANSQYLLTGDNGLLLTSPDATTWTRRTTGTSSALRSAAYNATNNTWVVLSNTTFPATILTSTDSAATWLNRTTGTTYNNLNGLATDGTSSLISVGGNGTIVRSANGTTWSTVTSGVTDHLSGVAFGAGKYVAVGAAGRILTSPTGTTWTAATSGTTAQLEDVFFLNGQWLVSGDSGLLLRSTDGATWTSATLATGGFNLQGIAFGSGRYVTVARGGRILTSIDAATWTAATSGTTADLTGIAYGNNKFIALSATAVLTSTNGTDWTSAPAPEIPGWESGTVFINGQFYAGSGPNSLLTSTDGLVWNGHHLGTNYADINGAAAYLGRLYVIGDSGMIYSSALAPAIVTQPLGQVFAAGSPATFRVTAAGSSLPTTYQWRKGGAPISGATSATYTLASPTATDQGNYDVVVTTSAGSVTSVSVNLGTSGGTVPVLEQQSTFGVGTVAQAGTVLDLQMNVTAGTAPITVQWQKNGANVGAPVVPDAAGIAHLYLLDTQPSNSGPYTAIATNAAGSSAPVVNNQAQFLVNQSNWNWRHPYPQALGYNGIAANGAEPGFVAFGPRGYFATSTDGAGWGQERSLFSSIVRGYISGNGRHLLWASASLAVGKFDEELVSSHLGEFEGMNDVGFGNGLFVAVCFSGRIFTSPDGLKWTERPSGVTESINRIAYGAGTFVAVTATGQLLRSTDALTWTAPQAGPLTTSSLLKFVNGAFFTAGSGGTLASSTNGTAWTTLTTGVTNTLTAIAHGSGRYHAVGSSGRIVTSTNGVDWTTRTSGSSVNLTGIAFANNVWCAVSNSTSTVTILTSAVDVASGDNGVTWTNRAGASSTATFNDLAVDGTSSIVAVGTSGSVLRSTDGSQWNSTTPAGNVTLNAIAHTGSAYFLVGDGGTMRSSADSGATWTTPSSGTTNHLRWIGRLNNVLHAVGAAGTLLTSADGATWTPLTTGVTDQLNGAAFGASTYVLVGNAGTIFTSANGTSWAPATSGVTGNIQEVVYGNSTFVAVGDNGIILTSPNGTTWTSRSFGLPENFTHVTFAHGVFIISGSASGLFVSTDGINWSARYTGNGGTATRLRAAAAFNGHVYSVGAGGTVMSASLFPTDAIDPVSVSVATGSPARFQITPRAFVLPATYQWSRGGLAIPGATDAYLTIPDARSSDSGSLFSVVITTAAGSYASDPALLTVAPTAYPAQIAADPTWDPNPVTISTRTFAAVKLANGQFLAGGESVRWDGHPRTALARLNADLTLDPTWTPPLINGIVYALAASADGSIVYVGGDFTAVDGHTRPGLARLVGPNLNLDLLWRPLDPLPASPSQISALALQDNGQLLVARLSFVTGAVTGTNVLRRLEFTGAHDTTFSVDVTTAVAGQRIHTLIAEPSPSTAIAFAGSFTAVNGTARGGVARVNSTGATLDTAFGGTGGASTVNFLTRLSSGRYVVGGNFTSFAGSARNRVAVLDATTGALDTTFAPAVINTTNGNAHSAVELSDGRLLVFGNFTRYANNDTAGFIRLNGTTGAFDSALTVGTGTQTVGFNISGAGRNMHAFRLNDQDQVGFIGSFNELLGQRRVAVARINAGVSNTDASDVAKTLVATPSVLVHRPAFTGAAFLEKNGALTVFGSADIAGGTSGVGQILRINPNGSLDSTFPGGTGFGLNGLSTFGIYRAARQGDGKYVAVGDFNSYNGTSSPRIVRINSDGTRDATFDPGTGLTTFIVTPVALSGGRTLLFGFFGSGTYNGTTVTGNILRLNSDGTRDTTFTPGTGFGSSSPAAVLEFPFPHGDAIEETGKLLVGGNFTTYNGAAVPGLVLLRPDGTRDTAFAPVGPSGGTISGFVLLPDGRIVVHGSFTSFNGTAANRVAIISSADGSLDATFTAPAAVDAAVNQVLLQADGKLLLSGEFSSGPALRLTAAGAIDNTFALRGITGFPGGSSGARFLMADDGSLYLYNTLVSLDYSAPRALVRFKGAATAPTIAQAPHGGALTVGSPFVFSVRAAGTAPYTYQWKKNDAVIDGATDSVYFIPSAAATDAGNYTVAITGPGGNVTSVPVSLAEVTTVAIADQPASRKVAAGATVSLAVSATTTVSGATLTYQWRKAGTAIANATSSTLTLTRVTAADAVAYTVVVADGTGTITSQPAVLTVTPPDPVLWQQFTEFATEQAPARTIHDGTGKVYVPWSVQDRAPDMANGKLVGALARFDEATGALDPAFRLDARVRRASHVVVQPDGKLLVAVSIGDSHTVIRVTDTGAPDTATPFTAPLFARGIRYITRQADGKVLVAAADNVDASAPVSALGADTGAVYRLNANGTVDPDFTRATVNSTIFGPPVVDSTGRIYLAGSFNTVNDLARLGVARLTSTGALDSTFPTGLPAGFTFNQIRAVALQSGDRPVVVGDFHSTPRGTAADRVMAFRFTSAGAFDSTFAQPLRSELGLGANLRLRHLLVEADDTILAVSDRLVRLTANGAKDPAFPSRAFGKEAFWISRGANNHLFFADQTSVFGQNIALSTVSNGIAVLSPTGTGVSPSFQTGGWGRIAYPTAAAVLSDGRYWIAGDFNRLGATPVPGLALFEADGTPSTAQIGMPRSMALSTVAPTLSDHVFAIVGQPSNSSESGLPASLVRLTSGLTADSGFAPVLPAGYDFATAALHPAPAGKLILAQGSISAQAALNGATGDALLRLNANGARDTDYLPALSSFAVVERSSTNGPVTMIRTGGLNVAQILPDGRALLVVSAVDGNLRLLRLTATGSVDPTFNAPSFGTITTTSAFTTLLNDPVTSTTAQFPISIYSASDLIRTAVQMPDGKVYVGGRFQLSYANAPRGLARLHADGTLDTTFTGAGIAFAKADSGPCVSKLAVDSVGRLYVAGRIDTYHGSVVPGLFRLRADGALDTSWNPGFAVLDAPRADVNLIVAGDKLHAFGTVGQVGDPLPAFHRAVTLTGAPVTVPATGSGGSTIALGGFGFTGTTAVNFNGLAATFTVVSDTSIVVTVPTFATTGPVTIVTPGGTQTVAGTFTVTPGANLVNLSSRAVVGTGENALLANFTVEGSTKTILLRAVGPTLAVFGILGTLADPVLTLHDATGAEIARNDDWGGGATLNNAFFSVGAFPFAANSKDSALLVTLAPGTYTARVTGAGGTTGLALVEVYDTGTAQRLSHLALRARTGTGGGVSIAGLFIASGSASRTVLIRAVGSPLVTALGAAADPLLTVFNSAGSPIATNDNWVTSADLTAATAAAGALPLAAADSALLLTLAPGSYTVQTNASTTGFALTEIHAIDSFRAAAFKPALLAPLQNQTVAPGSPLYLNAPVLAKPAAVTYLWKKDGAAVTTGVPVAGSPGALHLPAAIPSDTGVYTVEMTNSAGTTVSAPATVSVTPPPGYSATHSVASGYLAGGTVTITNTLTYASSSGALGWSVVLPAGWSYVSSAGSAGDSQPAANATDTISWAWTTVPPSPVTFTYTLAVPAGETAARALTAIAVARPGGNAVVYTANPNPLVVARVSAHKADTNADFRLSLVELTRVIELFNTRNGTTRTGRYSVATTTTEDGFAPDPVTADSATVTLTNYHSADNKPRDGKIGLVELTRVIELYNTRSGTVRTGAYRPAVGTEDGYEPSP